MKSLTQSGFTVRPQFAPLRLIWPLVVQVVGYMGVDYRGKDMTSHPQYITVRNERGQRMLDTVKPHLQTFPTMQVTAADPSEPPSHFWFAVLSRPGAPFGPQRVIEVGLNLQAGDRRPFVLQTVIADDQ